MEVSAVESLIRRFHREGFVLVDRAIKKEEDNGSLEEIVLLYKEGIKKFAEGIKIKVPNTEKNKRCLQMQEKMRINFRATKDRLLYLSQKSKGQCKNSALHPARHASGKAVSALTVKQSSTQNQQMKALNSCINVKNLRNVDSEMALRLLNELIDTDTDVSFATIIGNDEVKKVMTETVILPCKRPDLFVGLRKPVSGILLFGAPGNGKTLLAKAVANESGCKFFNISASTIVSKWVGESEKLVHALFAVARELQPSIIFIDEIDSLLTHRTEDSRNNNIRLVNQFLSECDGVSSSKDDRILLLGATNRPDQLDEAAIRRFPKRLLIPMPNEEARLHLIQTLLKDMKHSLTSKHLSYLAKSTQNYSCSDLTQLCMDATMNPLREMTSEEVLALEYGMERPVSICDFTKSMKRIRSSLNPEKLKSLLQWNEKYGDVNVKCD